MCTFICQLWANLQCFKYYSNSFVSWGWMFMILQAPGHSSRISPCLAVSRVRNIQPPDTKEIEYYLKHNYRHLLPKDISLYNFGSLGNKIEVDILLGVTDIAFKVIIIKSCGLHVYKSPLYICFSKDYGCLSKGYGSLSMAYWYCLSNA